MVGEPEGVRDGLAEGAFFIVGAPDTVGATVTLVALFAEGDADGAANFSSSISVAVIFVISTMM